MLRLPILSINDLWNEISTYQNTSEDSNYYLFQYKYMVLENRSNNNFLCAFLISTEDNNEDNNEEYNQSIFLVDMFGICLIAKYSLDIHYDWLDSFINGEITVSNYDKYGDYVDSNSIFINNEENIPVSINRFKDINNYHKYTNYMNTLCDKLCLVNKLKIVINESKRITELIERCYGKKSQGLIELNELYLQVKNELNHLKHNYPKETLGLIR